jgi:hypothetical protein
MNKKAQAIPTTQIFDSDEFAHAFRNKTLCLAFERLTLSGPEGSFEAEGVLVNRGEKLLLECSPKKGVIVPQPAKKGHCITYGPEDFWSATGRTHYGLNLAFTNITPPFWNASTLMRQSGTYNCYDLEIRNVRVYEDPVSEEAKAQLQETFRLLRARSNNRHDEPVAPRVVDARLRACIPNTKLELFNCGVKRTEQHPFFEGPSESHDSSCFRGELDDWEFCFSQEDEDVFLYTRTKEGYSSPSIKHDLEVMNSLLSAFAFMQGLVVVPWRIRHKRGDGYLNDDFVVEFESEAKGPTPIGGSKTYDLRGENSLPAKMMSTLARYFCSADETVGLMKSFHWQHIEAARGNSIKLYQCLHLCALLEGISKQLLMKRFGWSKRQWDKASAEDRIKSAVQNLKLPWAGGFESIYAEWKGMRHSLAHGDFFGPEGAWEGDLFSLSRLVSGGIMALILADAGWNEPFDFYVLSQTKHLYY